MVGQVVADQGVEQVGVVVQVGGGDRDQLPVPGRGGVRRRAARKPAASAGCWVTSAAATSKAGESFVLGPLEDFAGGRGIAADQPAQQRLEVRGHAPTVLVGPDDPLTAT